MNLNLGAWDITVSNTSNRWRCGATILYSWDMQNFDGLFILSHKHKIILQKFTESFLNAIRTLSENIEFFNQEMVRPGNDRILMPKNE